MPEYVQFKVCSRCKHPKDPSGFPPWKRSLDGLASWCRECKNINARKRYGERKQTNPKPKVVCHRLDDLTGKKFGRLLVKSRGENSTDGKPRWLCLCDCGEEKVIRGQVLRNGHAVSCGCYRREARQVIPQVRLGHGEAAKHRVISDYKSNARARGLSFSLTEDELLRLFAEDCVYCGRNPSNVAKGYPGSGDFVYSGIDRRDNTRGYESGNCVASCHQCNWAKRDLSAEDFIDWVGKAYSRFGVGRGAE